MDVLLFITRNECIARNICIAGIVCTARGLSFTLSFSFTTVLFIGFSSQLTILSPRIEKQQRYTCCIFSSAPAMLAILKIIYQGLTFYV